MYSCTTRCTCNAVRGRPQDGFHLKDNLSPSSCGRIFYEIVACLSDPAAALQLVLAYILVVFVNHNKDTKVKKTKSASIACLLCNHAVISYSLLSTDFQFSCIFSNSPVLLAAFETNQEFFSAVEGNNTIGVGTMYIVYNNVCAQGTITNPDLRTLFHSIIF